MHTHDLAATIERLKDTMQTMQEKMDVGDFHRSKTFDKEKFTQMASDSEKDVDHGNSHDPDTSVGETYMKVSERNV